MELSDNISDLRSMIIKALKGANVDKSDARFAHRGIPSMQFYKRAN